MDLADDHPRGLFRVGTSSLGRNSSPCGSGLPGYPRSTAAFRSCSLLPRSAPRVNCCKDVGIIFSRKSTFTSSVTPDCGKCSKSRTLRSHFGKTIAKSSEDTAHLQLFSSDCNSASLVLGQASSVDLNSLPSSCTSDVAFACFGTHDIFGAFYQLAVHEVVELLQRPLQVQLVVTRAIRPSVEFCVSNVLKSILSINPLDDMVHELVHLLCRRLHVADPIL